MDFDAIVLTFSLLPGLDVSGSGKEAFVSVAQSSHKMGGPLEYRILTRLANGRCTEAQLVALPDLKATGVQAVECCAALLFKLDQLGFLVRTVNEGARVLISSVPNRAHLMRHPELSLTGPLRLSPFAMLQEHMGEMSLEAPGGWARVTLHDRDLFPILHDLAAGRTVEEITEGFATCSVGAIEAVLEMMNSCNLLDVPDGAWPRHDMLLHTHTRDGYRRGHLGKTSGGRVVTLDQSGPVMQADEVNTIALDLPHEQQLRNIDPSFAEVSARRRSVRNQGVVPIGFGQLSEFLFRTFFESDGHRPYPSGGGCHPLTPYLVVDRCAGLAAGVYAYDPVHHLLRMVAETENRNQRLLDEAAGRAVITASPQVLVILAARFDCVQDMYGSLSYSLILKEVGAVFQMAMLSGAAMRLAVCPLGSGDSVMFSEMVGVDPLHMTSVGEFILGSRED
ncbi:MAG: SagB family peptide dehydrogenase [Paracoccaceae bacterium]